jgi:hypothetical protein
MIPFGRKNKAIWVYPTYPQSCVVIVMTGDAGSDFAKNSRRWAQRSTGPVEQAT